MQHASCYGTACSTTYFDNAKWKGRDNLSDKDMSTIRCLASDLIWPVLPPVMGGIPNVKMALFSPVLCIFPKYNKKSLHFSKNVKVQVHEASQKLR